MVGLLVSMLIELLQLGISAVLGYTYKITDVDDVILNTIGALHGPLISEQSQSPHASMGIGSHIPAMPAGRELETKSGRA